MIEYTKIKTLFNRSRDGSKELIVGDWANPTFEFLKDIQWDFSEKIDGTNISVVWDGHTVTFHGRTERAQIPKQLDERLHERFSGENNEQIFEMLFGEKEMILFGEGYGVKIQNGGGYSDTQDFIIFDVYSPSSDTWLSRQDVEEIASAFNVPCVSILGSGTLQQGIALVKEHLKTCVGKGEAFIEGIVCRPSIELKDKQGKRIICKIKYRDFK